jgi:nicotinamide-nucleotide amidase
MGPMLEGEITRRLAARVSGDGLYSRAIRLFGRSESHTEEAVRPCYPAWAAGRPSIEVTILAARGAIDLHLTTRASSAEAADRVLAPAVAEAVSALGDDVYSDRGQPLEVVVGDLLTSRGWHIAAAESCTGGMLLSRMTDIPGSSAYVEAGVVCYSNAAKVSFLGVDRAAIDSHGAVSEPVAAQMAAGIRTRTGAEVGVAITGIAGPGGGTADKPIGTVVIAVSSPVGDVVRTRRMLGGRDLIRAMSVNAALDMVRRQLQGRPVP